MLPLAAYRSGAAGLSDLLNYAALIDEGVVVGKDASLLAGFFYRGPDTFSATAAERNHLTERVNAALARFGSGWVCWHDAARVPVAAYPLAVASHFPDPISRLVDQERARQFQAAGAHFVTEHAVTFQYTAPLRVKGKVLDLIYDDDGADPQAPGDRALRYFKKELDDFEDAIGALVDLRRMGRLDFVDERGRGHLQDELANYLQFALTGEPAGLNIPPGGMYLDAVLGGRELFPGETPRLGERFLACVAIEGFPAESYPGVLEVLDGLSFPYRWSSRFIFLDAHEAVAEVRKYRGKWKFKVRDFWAQVLRSQGGTINEDALLMVQQTDHANAAAESGLVTYGYYTPVIVLMHENRGALEDQARLVVREIQRLGFSCRIETVNTMEAWLGALPGHPYPNVRRPLVHTLNLSDLLPLSSVWAGRETNPCPLYPPGSPPLLHAATAGATPFRLNLHVDDIAHTLIFGPTGAGKSVLLATIALQFLRYPRATICAFDKGRSMLAAALATGGRHYELNAEGETPALCPLGALDTEVDLAWSAEWVEACFQLQADRPCTPRERDEIVRALNLLRGSPSRSLTDFVATVQDAKVKSALNAYTLDGPVGRLLDGRTDALHAQDSSFRVFELDDLLAMGPRNAIPVLLYLFRRFEKSLLGQPSLLILDEAWVMLGHQVFREKIRDWLKTLRKANCGVVLATQSLSDAARSGLVDVLQESCATKIFLPNEEADKRGSEQTPGPRDLYEAFGLNETEVAILQTAIRKREYYVVQPEGRRLMSLNLGPTALAFTAVSSKEDVARVKALAAAQGEGWPLIWLRERGVSYEDLVR